MPGETTMRAARAETVFLFIFIAILLVTIMNCAARHAGSTQRSVADRG
jgi:hypothetical protein